MKKIMFLLIAVLLCAGAPANAYDWTRANQSIPAGPVWIANQAATVTAIDTKTLVTSDSIFFNFTTGACQRFVSGDTVTNDTQYVFGDTFYPTAGAAYDTNVNGYYAFTIDAPIDTPIVVNFVRPPRDITDGDYIAAGASRTYDLQVKIVFIRTSTGLAGSGHPQCVRIRKFR